MAQKFCLLQSKFRISCCLVRKSGRSKIKGKKDDFRLASLFSRAIYFSSSLKKPCSSLHLSDLRIKQYEENIKMSIKFTSRQISVISFSERFEILANLATLAMIIIASSIFSVS